MSGYIGGHTANPGYREVCGGMTGHAEAVAVTFDPATVPADVNQHYIFFATHDPTTPNRQGYDVGTQYCSASSHLDPGQEALFRAAIARHQEDSERSDRHRGGPRPTVPRRRGLPPGYYAIHPWEGYCQVIINPKLSKARKYYSQWLEP